VKHSTNTKNVSLLLLYIEKTPSLISGCD